MRPQNAGEAAGKQTVRFPPSSSALHRRIVILERSFFLEEM